MKMLHFLDAKRHTFSNGDASDIGVVARAHLAHARPSQTRATAPPRRDSARGTGGHGTYPGSGVHEGPVPQQAAHHLRLPRPGGHVQRRLPALRAQRGRSISDRPHSAAS